MLTQRETRVKAISEWPYTTEIRRNLVLSTLLPVLLWLLQEVGLDYLKQQIPLP